MTTSEAINIFYKDYDMIGMTIVTQLVNELKGQGHVATGALVRSVIASTQTTLDGIETAISHIRYGTDLNTGIPANRVPRRGSAEYMQLLTGLIKWIRFKNLANSSGKAYRFASNIIRKAQKTGFPTPGAYKFSKNTRRTGWIDYVVATYQIKWEKQIEEKTFIFIDNYVDAKLEEIARKYSDVMSMN